MDCLIKTGTVHGANTFAYCNNNPVKYVDFEGTDANFVAQLLFDFFVTILSLYGFLTNLLSGYEFESVGETTQDANGMYSLYVQYQKDGLSKKKLEIIFGDHDAWKFSKNAVDYNNKMQMDHYGIFIENEMVGIDSINPNPDELGKAEPFLSPFFMSVCLGVALIFNTIKKLPIKKVYNYIWGRDGLDPDNSMYYFAFSVTGDKKFNGKYAYSIKLKKWVKIDI